MLLFLFQKVKVLRQRPSQVSQTAFMYKVLQYELNCKFCYRLFKQEKSRLIGSFHLKQKPIYFYNARPQNPYAYGQFSAGRGGGGAVNHLAKKFLQNAQIFTEQSKRNEGRTMQQHRPYWHMKVARYSFSGSIPVKFFLSIDYDTINKHLEKLPPQLY